MRTINYIRAKVLILCLIAVVSCEKYSVVQEESEIGSVVITVEVSGLDSNDTNDTKNASSYAVQEGVLGTGEYVIENLRIYVFGSNGELDKMELYENLNANHLVTQTIEVPKDLSKEIYFVANEPSAISDKLDVVTTAQQLKDIGFEIAEAMNKGFNAEADFSADEFLMPMTGTYNVLNAMADLSVYVALTRAVARVDLLLDKTESASSRAVELSGNTLLSVTGLSFASMLYPSNIDEPQGITAIELAAADMTLGTVASDKSTSQRVLSFYLAERSYDYTDNDSKITIEIDGLIDNGVSVESKSVTLGLSQSVTSELTQISRNYIYRIYASYNGTEIVADEFEVVDWTTVDVSGEIEGVMFAVDSEVAMDWLRNGNSYTSGAVSFGSNKPIEFYMPVSVQTDDETVPSYEFQLFEFEDMSAGKSYDLKEITLNNNYIFATTWIDSAVIHFTSAQSGYIVFTYTPVKVNYKIQSYPIRIKSDNVTKQMKAVYDNGYLSSSVLSDDWAKRAPGGVVFAKRGEANHPLTTPEILHRDEDGYYRGEYSATAEGGSSYCEEIFGDGWYMPSYADMIELASKFDELGVSYRFQNNGSDVNSGSLTEAVYWSSSASSQYPGYYWSADFMSRDYMIENLMERRDGSQTHFVRCLMDLQ